jgi:hypothetical protein
MSRVRDLASILTASSVLGTDVEIATAVSNHSAASDPHGDRAAATSAISTHAALTATHGISGAIVGTTDTQTLTNKTFTSPTINTATATSTVLISPEERTTVSATAAGSTVHFDASTQGVLYYTSNASSNWTLNIRGTSGTSLSSILAVGDAITVSFLATNGSTAYYQTAFNIDGSAVTPKYSGGTAPASGNTSSIDAYTYTIIKTAATPTYTVFGAGPVKYV